MNKGKPQDLGISGTGEGVNIEDRVSEFGKQFGVIIPGDVDKTVLESTTGEPASGLSTRDDRGLVTILANLPDTKLGYTARLTEGEEKLELGALQISKGGWMLEKTLIDEVAGYRTVEVFEGQNVVLKGQFKE